MKKAIKIIIASTAIVLSEALSVFKNTATVEAEYGDVCVEGSILTLAHHGPRDGRPCPCSLPNLPGLGIEAIGVSHIDLDTIGGIMAIMGKKQENLMWQNDFWRVAARIDTEGVHKLPTILLEEASYFGQKVMDALNAWWAFSESEEGRISPPRDGSAAEISLEKHLRVLQKIISSNNSKTRRILIEKGRVWAQTKEDLNKSSFVEAEGGVILRSSESFTNHLYNTPDSLTSEKAVVAYNLKTGSITISLADPLEGVSCKEIVQTLWGADAGGHDGIAGSPRGKLMSDADLKNAFEAMKQAIG